MTLTAAERRKVRQVLLQISNIREVSPTLRRQFSQIHEKLENLKVRFRVPYIAAVWLALGGKRNSCTNPECKNLTKFISYEQGFRPFCSLRCSRRYYTEAKYTSCKKPKLHQRDLKEIEEKAYSLRKNHNIHKMARSKPSLSNVLLRSAR